MSIPTYKKKAKENAQKAIALRNKLEKLEKLAQTDGKEAKSAKLAYQYLVNDTPFLSQIYFEKLDAKKPEAKPEKKKKKDK